MLVSECHHYFNCRKCGFALARFGDSSAHKSDGFQQSLTHSATTVKVCITVNLGDGGATLIMRHFGAVVFGHRNKKP